MASSRTSEREEERRFNLRTLVIASSASATAAVVTSQLWIAGTWIAAAATPVLVALISELLHRPTERIAERLTSDRPVLRPDRGQPGPAPDTAEPPPRPPSSPRSSPASAAPESAPVRVYRSGSPAPRRRKIAVGAVLGTGALALLIAVVVLTVPELVAGGAIGHGKGNTTFFSGDRNRSSSDQDKKQTPSDSGDRSAPATQTETVTSTEEEPAPEPSTATETETTPTAPAPAAEPTTPTTGEQP
jgi:hypothetical protein